MPVDKGAGDVLERGRDVTNPSQEKKGAGDAGVYSVAPGTLTEMRPRSVLVSIGTSLSTCP